MKRWRTNGAAGRYLVVLAILLAAGWLHAVRAEPKAPNAPTFSRATLDRIGDEVRNEVATGKIPGAILLIQQHGKPVYLENFGEAAVTNLYANPQLYAGDFDNAEFADRIAVLPLADQPGTRWNYSHSTDVLGRVVEVASGQTLFQFEKQRLFDPLGMSETAYYVADQAKWPRIAKAFPGDRFRGPGIRA